MHVCAHSQQTVNDNTVDNNSFFHPPPAPPRCVTLTVGCILQVQQVGVSAQGP